MQNVEHICVSNFIRSDVTNKVTFFGMPSSNSLYSVSIIAIKNLYVPFENRMLIYPQLNFVSSNSKIGILDSF